MEVLIVIVSATVITLVAGLGLYLRHSRWELHGQISGLRQEVARLSKSTVNQINSNTSRVLDDSTRQLLNAVGLSALDFSFPVMLGGFSIDAHHARTLMEVLQERKPRRILELGSGSSTVIIAKALQAMGQPAEAHIAVDHDARYLELTRQLCRLNGVEHLVRLEHCPLETHRDWPLPWYSRLPDLLQGTMIDLLVVDGPPAYPEGRERIREPALDTLAEHCSASVVVLLDDANRPGEEAIMTSWMSRHPDFVGRLAKDGKGVAILSRAQAGPV